ncbi:hypothetical protein SOVF_056830 [Spinacia oleracea]|nr:hypothetical protein SOVF_056830 [Spinacia oleracea]
MASSYSAFSSSLKCELNIIGVKNVQTKHKGNLFIRCYLCAGSNNRRIQVNTKEIASSSSSSRKNDGYIFWDDTFSLECNGTSEDSVHGLKEELVVFELRWRNTKSFLGGSQLIATAEMPWKNAFEAPKMEFQRWVVMTMNKQGNKLVKVEDGVKPPALQITMKVEVVPATATRVVSGEEMRKRRRSERLKGLDECGCKSNGGCYCSSCVDTEMLFIGLAFDAC